MKKYEKEFRLKSLLVALLRRYDIIAFCFIPLCLASFVITQFVMKKNYISNITVAKSTIITNEQYQNIQTAAKKHDILQKTLTSLDEKNIKHSDGSLVTMTEIVNGLSFPAYQSNMISASFSFVSRDKAITKGVLDELTSFVVESLRPRSAYSDLAVLESASDPYQDNKNMKYFLISTAASFALAYAVAVVYEVAADEIYNANDVARYGVSGIEVKVKKTKVGKNDENK